VTVGHISSIVLFGVGVGVGTRLGEGVF
jgi:hypothetical protein